MGHSPQEVIRLLSRTISRIVVQTESFKQQCHKSNNNVSIATLLNDDILNRIIDCLIRYKKGIYPLIIDGRHVELTPKGYTFATGLTAVEIFNRGYVLRAVHDAIQRQHMLKYDIDNGMIILLCGSEMDGDDTRRENLLTSLLEPFLSKYEMEIIQLITISDIKAGGRRRTRHKYRQKKHSIAVQDATQCDIAIARVNKACMYNHKPFQLFKYNTSPTQSKCENVVIKLK